MRGRIETADLATYLRPIESADPRQHQPFVAVAIGEGYVQRRTAPSSMPLTGISPARSAGVTPYAGPMPRTDENARREDRQADRTTGTRRVSSGAIWEPIVGYSRAVAAGDYIFVSGCTSIRGGNLEMHDDKSEGADFVHPGDAYAQTRQAIANVRAALEHLGAGLTDVVRTRMYVTDISRWQEYGRAHGEAFAGVMPATSMIEISGLVDPQMLVEVEAIAYKPGIGGPGSPPASGGAVPAEML